MSKIDRMKPKKCCHKWNVKGASFQWTGISSLFTISNVGWFHVFSDFFSISTTKLTESSVFEAKLQITWTSEKNYLPVLVTRTTHVIHCLNVIRRFENYLCIEYIRWQTEMSMLQFDCWVNSRFIDYWSDWLRIHRSIDHYLFYVWILKTSLNKSQWLQLKNWLMCILCIQRFINVILWRRN